MSNALQLSLTGTMYMQWVRDPDFSCNFLCSTHFIGILNVLAIENNIILHTWFKKDWSSCYPHLTTFSVRISGRWRRRRIKKMFLSFGFTNWQSLTVESRVSNHDQNRWTDRDQTGPESASTSFFSSVPSSQEANISSAGVSRVFCI